MTLRIDTSIVHRVSVIMTARNEERVIGEAISSILAQSFGDFELVLVDDGSEDRTAEIAGGFRDARIRIIRQANTGQPVAMNRAISLATGELIARHDADDLSLPERFSRQVAFLDAHPEVALVGTWALLRESRGSDRLFKAPTSDRTIRRAMAYGNPIAHTSVMMRRSAFATVSPYTDVQFEDYDLWIRMAEVFSLANLPEPLVIRRVREEGRGRSGRRSLALARKASLQRQAIRRLRLPVTSWIGLVPTLAGMAGYATLEWTGRLSTRIVTG